MIGDGQDLSVFLPRFLITIKYVFFMQRRTLGALRLNKGVGTFCDNSKHAQNDKILHIFNNKTENLE